MLEFPKMKDYFGNLFRAFILLLFCLVPLGVFSQLILPPDRVVTGSHNYYYNTMILHLQLFEDGRFKITGEKAPYSSMYWKSIKPYFNEGSYVENPPGVITLIDSIDREHFFWIPIGYLANKDLNGHPVLTPRYSERQVRSFPYSQRFGLVSGLKPEAILYSDGSVMARFVYFNEVFPGLIRKYQMREQGKIYPGGFAKFQKSMKKGGGKP
jgi:hypothetical protein